jgi:hypothetical protein
MLEQPRRPESDHLLLLKSHKQPAIAVVCVVVDDVDHDHDHDVDVYL